MYHCGGQKFHACIRAFGFVDSGFSSRSFRRNRALTERACLVRMHRLAPMRVSRDISVAEV
ncbi:hypothetical protein XAP6984_350039 [Xanthomonas phaseoli pv. phaseoli]|uniref:Transposase n=1 Tax=Xanthomonas campestris pv. phaseoli TaxID=317013 RepID=A0ABY1TRS3_XANCH|nr:hypothetical protein XAP6984_350039 [Xanthomonas phaseoli pv. phaseoli]